MEDVKVNEEPHDEINLDDLDAETLEDRIEQAPLLPSDSEEDQNQKQQQC